MVSDENFYFNKEEPQKSCLLAMRDILLGFDSNITETTKYGMPCFCYMGKMFCYLWMDKKSQEPYFLMVEGEHLNHAKLESGNRARMKIFKVDPNKDLPIIEIDLVMKQALGLYQSGTIII